MVKAAGPVLPVDVIPPHSLNDWQPRPKDESRLEVGKQVKFPGHECIVEFQGTFAQYSARQASAGSPMQLIGSQD